MGGAILVTSLLGVAAILLIIYQVLDRKSENQYAFKVILFAFILGIILLLGKTSVDYSNHCELLLANATVAGSITTYDYGYFCIENTNTTALTFYEITLWIARILIAYLVFAFAFEAIQYFGWWNRGGKQN